MFQRQIQLRPGARWEEGEIDLSPWAGKIVQLSLLTRADNTDHAWAGWGAPRVTTAKLSIGDRAVNGLLDAVRRRAMGTPFRHP